MDVRIDAGRGQDQVRARDGVGADAELESGRDPIHGLRVAGLANAADAPVLDADIGLHHPQHCIHDGDVGDHEIRCAGRAREPVVHAHAFAQAFAAAEDHFIARTAAQVALDFDKQAGIAQTNAIPDRRAIEAHILIA